MKDKTQVRLKALPAAGCQLLDVLDAPLGGGVGKPGVSAALQCNPLDLHKAPAGSGLKIKIKAGIAPALLRLQIRQSRQKAARLGPLLKDPIGGLGIHVDQQRFRLTRFFHANQVKVGFPARAAGRLQIDHRSRRQQLPAAPGILHMAHHLPAVQRHMGDKTVRAAEKAALPDGLILHGPVPPGPTEHSRRRSYSISSTTT